MSSDDTTTEGTTQLAEGQTTGEGGEGNKERQLTPRELAMDAIVVKREGEEEGADPASQVDAQVAQQTAPEPVIVTDPDKTMVKVKIDGEERLVPIAEVTAQYQKNSAADKRLAEATRLLEQARQQQAAPAQTEKPPQAVDSSAGGAQTSPTDQPQGGDTKQTVREFLASMFDGDEDKAADALTRLVTASRAGESPTQVDPSTLVTQLTPAVREQLANESALDRFLEQNTVIAEDPHLTAMTAGFLREEMQGGLAYPDALQAAGKRTTDWLGRYGGSAQGGAGPTTTRESKLAAKGRIDEINPASTSAASTAPAPSTPSSVIAEMRAARGLPV